ncbi:MAG: magnesium/cobalt transporter CorA, partial [Candidatus Omnitrophota bacterium]
MPNGHPGKIKITVIDYDGAQFQEKEVKTIEESFLFKDKPTVTWINVDGISDPEILNKMGEHFGIHPLVLEDILNTRQRPKFDDFDSYMYVSLKMISVNKKKKRPEAEQVSLILGSNFVISFQEREGDVFGLVRDKIRNMKGRIRKMGADYLAYALIDAIVDNYFSVLEITGERIDAIEKDLLANPTTKTVNVIHSLKRDMIFLRRSVWPLREAINSLEKEDSPLIAKTTRIYLRSVYDHTIQVIDTVETYRDMVSGMLDIYLSSISNKMNAVMKVLTII